MSLWRLRIGKVSCTTEIGSTASSTWAGPTSEVRAVRVGRNVRAVRSRAGRPIGGLSGVFVQRVIDLAGIIGLVVDPVGHRCYNVCR